MNTDSQDNYIKQLQSRIQTLESEIVKLVGALKYYGDLEKGWVLGPKQKIALDALAACPIAQSLAEKQR